MWVRPTLSTNFSEGFGQIWIFYIQTQTKWAELIDAELGPTAFRGQFFVQNLQKGAEILFKTSFLIKNLDTKFSLCLDALAPVPDKDVSGYYTELQPPKHLQP